MDASEWVREADAAAGRLQQELTALEDSVGNDERARIPGSFWPRLRDLQERVRTAPAIKLDDKLDLDGRLRRLANRVARTQREHRSRSVQRRASLEEALGLAEESLGEAATVDAVQEIRSDLTLIRKAIDESGGELAHRDRQEVWTRWQATNQRAWEFLNALWTDNEAALCTALEGAEARLNAHDARGTRDAVKQFHAETASRPCSPRAIRELQSRANRIWRDAEELSRIKHEAYLQHARSRLDDWRQTLATHASERVRLEAQIDDLGRRAAAAPTAVAAALLRGQCEERQRALGTLDAASRELERRIQQAESALSRA